MGESMYDRGLMIAHDNNARSAMGEEILHNRPGKTRVISNYTPGWRIDGQVA